MANRGKGGHTPQQTSGRGEHRRHDTALATRVGHECHSNQLRGTTSLSSLVHNSGTLTLVQNSGSSTLTSVPPTDTEKEALAKEEFASADAAFWTTCEPVS